MRRAVTLRAVAATLALVIPLGAYGVGDALDVFPGFVTRSRVASGPVEGAPAAGESWTASAPQRMNQVAASSAAAKPVPPQDLNAALSAAASSADVVAGNYAFCIVDAKSGEVLAAHDEKSARTPASTMKLLTSLAAVRHIDPDTRFGTSTRLDGSALSLVGGGDMLLTEKPAETKEGVPRASLSTLADNTATELKKRGVTSVSLTIDDTYFEHDPLNPAWGDNGPSGGWVAPIMPLGIDGGRADGTPYGAKSTDPAMDAGKVFRTLLTKRGISVSEGVTRKGPGRGETLSQVSSAPLSTLIEHTLLYSDNTVAELVARHVARATGHPTTAKGAAAAVKSDLEALASEQGFSTRGLVIVDNSGLSVNNRVAPEFFARLTAWGSGEAPPHVREMLSLVPVGGLSGTLSDRFSSAGTTPARGIIRGKTGYLGGVASLSGTTVLADGRTVGYSILVYGFDGSRADDARGAVDAIATAMLVPGSKQ